MTTRDRAHRTDAGQISSWLVKLVLGVAIVGFLVLEFGAVVVNRLQIGDIASTAGTEAGLYYSNTKDEEAAKGVAEAYVKKNGAELVAFDVVLERNEVVVTARKNASTRLIHKISALEGLVEIETTETVPLRK